MSLKLIPPGTRKGNKFYYILGMVDGRPIEVSAKTTDERTARQRLVALESKLKGPAGAVRAGEKATFAQAAQLYIEWRSPKKPELVRIEKVVELLGYKRIGSIRQLDIVEAANKMYPNGHPASKNRQVVCPAVAILHYAAKNGMCPWIRVSPFRAPKPKPRAVTTETASLVISAVKSDFYKRLLIVWLFCQGTRITDALRVEWSGIDLAKRVVKMRVHKTDEEREFPLHTEVVGLLETIEPEKREGRLFSWGDRHNVYRWLRPLVKEMGIKFTPHMARHSVGTWMVAGGAPLRTIMDALGHADVRSSLRYQAPDIELTRAEMAKTITLLPAAPMGNSQTRRRVRS